LELEDAVPEREPFDCPTAVFDGGLHDPRTLVYLYQQRVRATLLARAADEAAHPYSLRRAFSTCQDTLERCRDGLHWLRLARSHTLVRRRLATTVHPISAARRSPVRVESGDARPMVSPA
jgi:hypothetical protein